MRDYPRGRFTAVAVVVVMAGAYGLGNLLGGEGDPPPGPAISTGPTNTNSPNPDVAAALADVPRQPVAAEQQPITGPGRPPLKSGNGPYGSHRHTHASYVALTFDDGPDPRYTPDVLALLRDHDVRATFCLVGRLAAAYPELVRQIANEGHTMCNHTWGHDLGLGGESKAAIRRNLERTSAAIRAAAPEARISYYRQPGGRWTARVTEVATELGMSSLHWDVDPQDWRKPGARAISSTVNSATQPGSIVLLHDGGGERGGTVRALRRILPELNRRMDLDALPPGTDPPRMHGRELPIKPGQR